MFCGGEEVLFNQGFVCFRKCTNCAILAPLTALGGTISRYQKNSRKAGEDFRLLGMHHPYQCLAVARGQSGDILVAALGPQILTFDFNNGQLLSQWPQEEKVKVHEQRIVSSEDCREYFVWVRPWVLVQSFANLAMPKM